MALKKKSCLTLSQVLDDVFASSGSAELGESSNMLSEDEGDVIFRWPGGRGAVLTDSESERSRNSSRSTRYDPDSGGSELYEVDLGPGNLSDDGSHSSRQSCSPSLPPQGRSRGQGTGRTRGRGRGRGCGCGRGRGRGRSVALSRPRPAPAAPPDPPIIWHQRENVPVVHPFTGSPGIQIMIDKNTSRLDIFLSFLPEWMIDTISKEPNRYAAVLIAENPPPAKKKTTTPGEIKTFLAMCILMGHLKKPTIKMYWSRDSIFETAFFKNTMPRDRFLQIMNYFHICDNDTGLQRLGLSLI